MRYKSKLLHACRIDRKKEQTRRINFDRLQLINIGDCRMVQLSLMNSNWALISARMNRLIVYVVAVDREQNEMPTTTIKLESSAKLGFKNEPIATKR